MQKSFLTKIISIGHLTFRPNNMKKIAVNKVLCILLTLMMLVSCNTFKDNDKSIKIGVLYPQTGDAAYWGNNAINGALMAKEEFVPQHYLVDSKIEIFLIDSKSNPKDAISGLYNLIYQKKIKYLIGDLVSSNLKAIQPIINKNQIITIGQGSTPLLKQDDFIFRTFPCDDIQGMVISDFIQSRFVRVGLVDISIIYVNNEYGRGIQNAIIDRIGNEIKFSDSYQSSQKDFKNNLVKFLKTDVLIIIAYPEEVKTILKQLNEMNFSGIVIGTETFDNVNIRSQLNNYTIYYSTPKTIFNPNVSAYIDNYEKKYLKKPEMPSDMAFDGMSLLLSAIDSIGIIPYQIKSYLLNIKEYEGASGLIKFDKYGDVIKPFIINKLENGVESVVYKWTN